MQVEHWQHHPSVPDNSVIFEKKYRVGDKVRALHSPQPSHSHIYRVGDQVQIDAIADYNGARWGKVRAGPRPCQDTWVVLRTSTGQEMFTACDRPHPYNYTMHLPSAVVFSLPCSAVMSTPLGITSAVCVYVCMCIVYIRILCAHMHLRVVLRVAA